MFPFRSFQECFDHNGNIVFRHLIIEMLPKYAKADSKKQKMHIIRQVVDRIVADGGRFLKKDAKKRAWFDGGTVCGKDKVCCVPCRVSMYRYSETLVYTSDFPYTSSLLQVGHAFRDAKVQERRGAARLALKQQTNNPVNQQDPAFLAAMSLLILHRSEQRCAPLSPDKANNTASLSVTL